VFGLGAGGGLLSGWWPLLLVAPLLLHLATASISAWGARHGRRPFAGAFLAAVALHTTYNYAIVRLLGVGA
jgi:hypothetical protein